jgi:phosphoribosylamine--glycine ligase
MEILVIGGGGREHAIVHSLNKSKKVSKIYCAPGNAGISKEAECLPIAVNQFDRIAEFLDSHKEIGLTVVAPDNPLVDGLVNFLEKKGHRAFGPRAEAAIIEGSKIFSKKLMKDNNIPTAGYESFTDYYQAEKYAKNSKYPLVVKADGLAFGKGVIICNNYNDAEEALKSIMLNAAFGAGNTNVIMEEFLIGREVSILAFTDGKTVSTMLSSQDHKKAFDGDKGPNTGGMGAFSPSPYYTNELAEKTLDKIITPTLDAMKKLGRTFKGVIYFGLMITDNEPYTLEYNARFGDPETQAVLPLLESDLYEIMEAVIDERLADIDIKWSDKSAVTVVLASGGYPAAYPKGKEIRIIDTDAATVYHAGTSFSNGKLVTSGGRVIAVTALGKDIAESRTKAYTAIKNISFEGMFYRKDIGLEVK